MSSARIGLAVLTAAGAIAGLAACSLLLDWNGFTGGPPAAVSCGDNLECATVIDPGDAGWQGPLALYGPDATPPGCGTGFTTYAVFDAGPATCTECGCGSVTGGSCPFDISYYSDPGIKCADECGHQQLPSNTCVQPVCGSSFKITASPVLTGTCGTTGGDASLPAAFSPVARACPVNPNFATNSCGANQVCLSAPPMPKPPLLCYMTEGAATSCPSVAYNFGPYIYYSTDSPVMDLRGCTPCQCAVTGAGCLNTGVGTTVQYYDSQCVNPQFSLPSLIPGACTQIMNDGGLKAQPIATYDPGACTLTGGGQPMGEAQPTGQPTSFCCSEDISNL